MTDRSGRTEQGSHEYQIGKFTACRMADDEWFVFCAGKDTGKSFKTLLQCQQWIAKQ